MFLTSAKIPPFFDRTTWNNLQLQLCQEQEAHIHTQKAFSKALKVLDKPQNAISINDWGRLSVVRAKNSSERSLFLNFNIYYPNKQQKTTSPLLVGQEEDWDLHR